jgi:prepilin-type N-terminal cleavage/methylation domain-containing protein
MEGKVIMKTKSNNSGFSLVELIVVIAIMAVLVGVLAPTLIGNIEKSRESKDLQNLDTIRQAAITAIANEAAYKEVVPSSATTPTTLTVSWSSGKATATGTGVGASGAFNEEFSSIVTSDPTMSSNAASAGTIQLVIDSTGAVTAQVVDASNAVVSTVKTKDSNNNVMSFQSK